jgi:modification methylase
MSIVASGEAQLVVTSPPYFAPETEALLRAPREQQREHERVQKEVVAYALTLRPVFREIGRVLAPNGTLVMQTRDIRYGGFLIALAAVHTELAESGGLRLRSRIFWQSLDAAPHNSARTARLTARTVGAFRGVDVEEFLVFQRPEYEAKSMSSTGLSDEELKGLAEPCWRTAGPGRGVHPYRSPPAVVRRFVQLYSSPGDLVVDPFSGFGTTIRAAVELKRKAIGYEIEERWARESFQSVAKALARETR